MATHVPQRLSLIERDLGNRDQARRDAQTRLERFATEFFVDEHPEFRWLGIGRIAPEGLQEASEELLAVCQRHLLRLRSPVEPRLAKKLARDRYWAISALIYKRDNKHAKETQLRVTGGAPLAICMGDVCRIGGIRNLQTVTTVQGTFNVSVKGCRAIFRDVVRTDGGKMWPGLCPACRNPHKKPARDQNRALRRRLNAMYRGDSASVYEWSVRSIDSGQPERDLP